MMVALVIKYSNKTHSLKPYDLKLLTIMFEAKKQHEQKTQIGLNILYFFTVLKMSSFIYINP